jgi:hypothetical protein
VNTSRSSSIGASAPLTSTPRMAQRADDKGNTFGFYGLKPDSLSASEPKT